ncbi:hypothetical protein AB0J43_02490 [Nonomuraea fuscirosea]
MIGLLPPEPHVVTGQVFTALTHRREDVPAVAGQLRRLYDQPGGLALPDPSYVRRFINAISTQDSGYVPDCFGGARLSFAQPDGAVSDCPSDRRLAATPTAERRTIQGADARILFADPPACTNCTLLSWDCVNMWPLVLDMPQLLNAKPSDDAPPGRRRRAHARRAAHRRPRPDARPERRARCRAPRT